MYQKTSHEDTSWYFTQLKSEYVYTYNIVVSNKVSNYILHRNTILHKIMSGASMYLITTQVIKKLACIFMSKNKYFNFNFITCN